MGFCIWILIKTSPPKGGVHKLMILLRDLRKEFLRKFFGEEMGGGQGDPDPLVFKIHLDLGIHYAALGICGAV